MKINEIIVEGPKWDRFKRGTQRFFGGKPSLSKENPNDELAAAWEGFNTYYQSLVDAGRAPKLTMGNPAGSVEYNEALWKYLMQGKSPADQSKFVKPSLTDTSSKSNAQAYIKKMQAIARVDRFADQPAPDPIAPQVTPQQNNGAQVRQGYRLVVSSPQNGGKYFKTDNGWTNAHGDAISDSNSVQYLERLVDSGVGKEEIAPPASPPPPRPVTTRRRNRHR